MAKITTVRIEDEHAKWVDDRDINLSKFVRRCINNEIKKAEPLNES